MGTMPHGVPRLIQLGTLTVDTSEALDDDGPTTEVAWLQSSVFSGTAFSQVIVSHYHPWNIL